MSELDELKNDLETIDGIKFVEKEKEFESYDGTIIELARDTDNEKNGEDYIEPITNMIPFDIVPEEESEETQFDSREQRVQVYPYTIDVFV